MAKKSKGSRKNSRRDHERVIDSVSTFDGNYKKVIIVVSIIAIFFAGFYFLTVYITNNSSSYVRPSSGDGSISYTEIMVGRSFKMPEKEYLVLYYDRSDSELLNSFSTVVSNYRNDDTKLTLYNADMSSSMNKNYVGEAVNYNPTNVSELVINGPTLVHFRDGAVIEYIEGTDNIVTYLS